MAISSRIKMFIYIIFKGIVFLIGSIRIIPHWIIYNFHPQKHIIHYDVERWLKLMGKNYGIQYGFFFLMNFMREYRNLFYYRIGFLRHILKLFCKLMNTLFIGSEYIGPGLFIQHGFATIIEAKSVGKDCWINQQVTIGFNGKDNYPIIGDNVAIRAGAKVIGNIIIGNNVKIGANAVVVKNVPDNCTVVGVPAYIVRKDGVKIKEGL